MKLSFVPVALALVGALAACSNSSEEDTPEATDDANELNARKLQVFECKTDKAIDNRITEMSFSIRYINDNKKIQIYDKNGKDPEDYSPVKVSPEGRLSSLNENLSVATGTRSLRISGDADGFYLLNLVLYKNSGYTAGYVRISGADPDPNAYSKVSCTVTQKN
jgi:hypothetical protein